MFDSGCSSDARVRGRLQTVTATSSTSSTIQRRVDGSDSLQSATNSRIRKRCSDSDSDAMKAAPDPAVSVMRDLHLAISLIVAAR